MLLLLIDALNLIRRVHAGVPGDHDTADHFESALTAITHSVGRALQTHSPTHAACVMDPEGPTWRHAQFPDYKKGRTPMPSALRDGLPRITQAITQLGVSLLQVDGFEADDIVATLAVRTASHKGRVTVLSTDTKFCQLLQAQIEVFDHFKRVKLDAEFCQQRFGVAPDQLRDWYAMVGDSSLNLRGVNGVGAKTAAQLLNDYKSLDGIYAALDEIKTAVRNKLITDRESAELAYELLGFDQTIDLGINLKDLRYQPDRDDHSS